MDEQNSLVYEEGMTVPRRVGASVMEQAPDGAQPSDSPVPRRVGASVTEQAPDGAQPSDSLVPRRSGALPMEQAPDGVQPSDPLVPTRQQMSAAPQTDLALDNASPIQDVVSIGSQNHNYLQLATHDPFNLPMGKSVEELIAVNYPTSESFLGF